MYHRIHWINLKLMKIKKNGIYLKVVMRACTDNNMLFYTHNTKNTFVSFCAQWTPALRSSSGRVKKKPRVNIQIIPLVRFDAIAWSCGCWVETQLRLGEFMANHGGHEPHIFMELTFTLYILHKYIFTLYTQTQYNDAADASTQVCPVRVYGGRYRV